MNKKAIAGAGVLAAVGLVAGVRYWQHRGSHQGDEWWREANRDLRTERELDRAEVDLENTERELGRTERELGRTERELDRTEAGLDRTEGRLERMNETTLEEVERDTDF